MQRKIALAAWFCWLLTSAVVLGGPKAGTVDPKVFVSQLGDDSFAVREAAAKHLQELGKAAEAALQGASTDPDPEVCRQVKILLDRLDRSELELALAAFLRDGDEQHMEQLPAWKRFSQLAGNDTLPGALFIDVCTSESALVTALDTDPRAAAGQFAARCQSKTMSRARNKANCRWTHPDHKTRTAPWWMKRVRHRIQRAPCTGTGIDLDV